MRCAADSRYPRQRWPTRRARGSSNGDAGPWVDRRPREVTFRCTLRRLSTRTQNRYPPAAADARCIMRAAQTQIRIPSWIPARRKRAAGNITELPPGGRRRTQVTDVRSSRGTTARPTTRCRAAWRSPGRRSCGGGVSRMTPRRSSPCQRRISSRRDRERCRRSGGELVRTPSAPPRF